MHVLIIYKKIASVYGNNARMRQQFRWFLLSVSPE